MNSHQKCISKTNYSSNRWIQSLIFNGPPCPPPFYADKIDGSLQKGHTFLHQTPGTTPFQQHLRHKGTQPCQPQQPPSNPQQLERHPPKPRQHSKQHPTLKHSHKQNTSALLAGTVRYWDRAGCEHPVTTTITLSCPIQPSVFFPEKHQQKHTDRNQTQIFDDEWFLRLSCWVLLKLSSWPQQPPGHQDLERPSPLRVAVGKVGTYGLQHGVTLADQTKNWAILKKETCKWT